MCSIYIWFLEHEESDDFLPMICYNHPLCFKPRSINCEEKMACCRTNILRQAFYHIIYAGNILVTMISRGRTSEKILISQG